MSTHPRTSDGTADHDRPARPANAVPGLNALLVPTTELYLDLHRHPELSGAERRTAARFADWLEADGFRVVRDIGGHGVAAELHNGDGPAVLLRAELDALPVAEDTGVPYASSATAPGPDGRPVPVMHACGHDAHLACAAAAARWLAARRDHWRGTLLVVGQPAEETLSGARALLEDGLYERITPPDEVLAQHTAPFPAGMVAHADGPVMAGSVTLEVLFEGDGGHVATPHLTANPLLAAAGAVVRLPAVAAHASDPAERVVVAASSLRTGNTGHTGNVIATSAVLHVTVRAFSEAALDRVASAVEHMVREEAATDPLSPRVTVTVLSRSGITLPDPDLTAAVRAAHRAHFGAARVTGWPGASATEDFPLLTGSGAHLHGKPRIRGAYWMLGATSPAQWRAAPGTGADEKLAALPANHSPRFLPSVRLTLETGTAALVTAALARLGPPTARTVECPQTDIG
ncbi:amidohydrolase [Streptomyces gibsoniae]|uniref:Amidohydrolase n=1 Tax=Streptomyces gibsoniae TaxID=3075529 RepID=A0ABU2U086_9ACTN|nr:amidohydrolase [Streptomyces sp. DSM 41699]MDT0466631.1 amidohydrolase [Streptomyces sp. DSM 41699]